MDMWIQNVALFTEALGVENAPAIFAFADIPWPDSATRDEFIKDLTGKRMGNNY